MCFFVFSWLCGKKYFLVYTQFNLKISETGVDFCSLSKNEIIELKEKYPLRIEFGHGKIEIINITDEQ